MVSPKTVDARSPDQVRSSEPPPSGGAPAVPGDATLAVPRGFRGIWRADAEARDCYAEGAGIARIPPRAIAVPVDADDVATLVAAARREQWSLIPRGSGSGMAAGAVGPDVLMDLSRLKAIGPVDQARRTVRLQPGALRNDVDAAARKYGLRFPVDPSSGAFCTVGGMVATNAAGARSLRFGATRAWVRGLECVFANGVRAWIRHDAPAPTGIPPVRAMLDALASARRHVPADALRHSGVRKESSGYAISAALDVLDRDPNATGEALLALLVGSEGTLALFTSIELALTPVAGATATVLASFSSLEAATQAAVAAREAGASACELLDRTFLDVAARDGARGLPRHAEAVLLAEVEGENGSAARDAAVLLGRAFRRGGAFELTTATHPLMERRLWSLRHAASPILARLAPRLRSMQFIEDGCVPPDRLPEYVRGIREALDRADTTGVIFGHAGDAHVHVNPLLDVTRSDWRDRVHRLLEEGCELTSRLGGTLAGEHGDGRLRATLLPRMWNNSAMEAFRVIKRAADPHGVLNRGVKVAVTGDDPLRRLRHDPDAPALHERARQSLDAIERDRAWHRFRLAALGVAAPSTPD